MPGPESVERLDDLVADGDDGGVEAVGEHLAPAHAVARLVGGGGGVLNRVIVLDHVWDHADLDVLVDLLALVTSLFFPKLF